ncbi:MAG: Na/Pi cotransporter family protein [Eubacterium sp.]|jgi:phosphate:Na+ symporter
MSLTDAFSLLGGVGLFLFGMTMMSSGLKNACGENLQQILEKATKNKYIAILIGIGVTMLIQSSSATDVMVIGFVNSGMMTLNQAVGVIMGANIGTTITAQITAFDLASDAPLILFVGVILYLFVKQRLVKHVGEIIMGFGMLFVGISIMKSAILPLAESETFVKFMTNLDNPAVAVLFGIGFTALLQSSSSSTVIFQTFAVDGILSFNTAAYLVIGAAIGSVTPNILASLTTNRNGKRSALINLLFNVFRAFILIALINIFPQILTWIQGLSPNDIGRQIANMHTIFAVIAVLVEMPFAEQIVKLTEKIIPIKTEESETLEERKLKYMVNLQTLPAGVAIAQAHKEVTRMGRIAAKNLRKSILCFFDYTPDLAESVRTREVTVNILNHTIADAMTELRAFDLSREQLRRVSMMTIAVTDIERLSDHAENIVEYAEELISNHQSMSPEATAELKEMAKDSLSEVDLAIDIFETEDYSKLDALEAIEARVDEQETSLVDDHVERLMQAHCDPLSGVVFTDIVTDLERCADHAVNIAYALKERPEDLDLRKELERSPNALDITVED